MMIRSVLASVAALAVATSASAAIFTVTVAIDGLQEVLPNASPGTGTAEVTVNDVTGLIIITGSYSGLLAPVAAAHLHGLAPAGANAGVLFALGTTGGTSGTFSGSATLSPANLAGLMANLTYINIHTSLFPGGEIRGQVIVPAPVSLLAFITLPLAARRRRA